MNAGHWPGEAVIECAWVNSERQYRRDLKDGVEGEGEGGGGGWLF